ncbi:MAG TPA: RDD family protein [Streptosporangiaceae bacterium]
MDDARAAEPSRHDRTGSPDAAPGAMRAGSGSSPAPVPDPGYAGDRLGLPREGGGSVAGYGRRLGALFIDWLVALLTVSIVAMGTGRQVSPGSLWPLVAFGVETWLLTAVFGRSVGKSLLGMRVVRLDGRPVGPLWALVRTALLVVVVPALLWDRDYRGLHDRAAATVVVRT